MVFVFLCLSDFTRYDSSSTLLHMAWLFFFVAEHYSVLYTHRIFFIRSSVGHAASPELGLRGLGRALECQPHMLTGTPVTGAGRTAQNPRWLHGRPHLQSCFFTVSLMSCRHSLQPADTFIPRPLCHDFPGWQETSPELLKFPCLCLWARSWVLLMSS